MCVTCHTVIDSPTVRQSDSPDSPDSPDRPRQSKSSPDRPDRPKISTKKGGVHGFWSGFEVDLRNSRQKLDLGENLGFLVLGVYFQIFGDFGPNFGFWIWGGDRRFI